jgi:hypothetical protein
MRLLTILAFSFVLFGCGAGGYTGTFYSQGTSALRGQQSAAQERIVFNLTQNGSTVTGSFAGEYSAISGQFNGTVNGDSLTQFTMTLPSGQACTTLMGSGTYSNFNMTLTYTGQCSGAQATGSIVAVKQVR